MPWLPAKPRPDSLAVGALLTAMIAMGQLSTAIYVPSMPSLTEALGATPEQVTLTFTVFLAGFGVAQLVLGPLSDRVGRRVVLLSGVSLFVAASIACALAPTIGALTAARVVQAIGACGGSVLGRAIVRDVYGRERAARVLAFIGVAFSLSPAVSPIIGGYLQVWFGWRASFVFLTIIGLAIAAAITLMLDETNRHPDPRALNPVAMARNFATLLSNRVYLGYMLAMAMVFCGMMGFVTASPFLLIDDLGLRPDTYGLLAALTVIGTLTGNLSAGVLTMRIGIERLVLAGTLLATAGGAVMAGLGLAGHFSAVTIVGPAMIFVLGWGLTMPNAMAGALAPFPRMAGTASALLGFCQMSAAAMATLVAGHMPHGSQVPLGLLMAAVGACGLLAFLALAWAKRAR